eukprot:403359283
MESSINYRPLPNDSSQNAAFGYIANNQYYQPPQLQQQNENQQQNPQNVIINNQEQQQRGNLNQEIEEDIQQKDAKNREQLLSNYLLFGYLLFCLWYFPKDKNCSINDTTFLWNVCWWILFPLIVLRQIMKSYVTSLSYVRYNALFQLAEVHNFFSFGAASISGIIQLTPYNYECYVQPQPNFINFHLIVLYGIGRAMIITVIAALVVFFSPCIIFTAYSLHRQRQQQRVVKEDLIKNIFKVNFSRQIFPDTTDCAICLGDLQENEIVTPLPCDMRHVYHSDCIIDWFKQNNSCPLCKAEVSKSGMKQIKQQIMNLIKN